MRLAGQGRDYLGKRQVSLFLAPRAEQADSTTIASRVSGYVAKAPVGDNEPVKAGQTLAGIDDRDFRVALDSAVADVAAAQAAILSQRATLQAQDSVIASARATLAVEQAKLAFASRRTSAIPRSPPAATAR